MVPLHTLFQLPALPHSITSLTWGCAVSQCESKTNVHQCCLAYHAWRQVVHPCIHACMQGMQHADMRGPR